MKLGILHFAEVNLTMPISRLNCPWKRGQISGQQIQFMDNLRTNPNLIKIDLSKSVEIKP